MDQIYEANKKSPSPNYRANVNNSVGVDSRLSTVSAYTNTNPKVGDEIRISYVGTLEQEKETKVTLQFEPWELESAKGCGKRTGMFTKYAL